MKIRSAVLEKSFIPKFNGNKELPTGEQVVVEIKEHISNLQVSLYKKFSMDKNGMSAVKYDDISIARIHIGKIANLEEENGTKITNGIELADSKNKLLYDLMVEIRDYLFNTSEELPKGEK